MANLRYKKLATMVPTTRVMTHVYVEAREEGGCGGGSSRVWPVYYA